VTSFSVQTSLVTSFSVSFLTSVSICCLVDAPSISERTLFTPERFRSSDVSLKGKNDPVVLYGSYNSSVENPSFSGSKMTISRESSCLGICLCLSVTSFR
jgi:hypothetical protein